MTNNFFEVVNVEALDGFNLVSLVITTKTYVADDSTGTAVTGRGTGLVQIQGDVTDEKVIAALIEQGIYEI